MSDFIKQAALSVGFEACGIAKADALTDDAVFMKQWLHDGNHGEMHYLARNFEKRTDPRLLVPDCKSIVVVLLNYYPTEMQNPTAPKIAKYAYSEIDYHTVIKAKLTELEKLVCDKYGADAVHTQNQHTFVDSAPVLERRWAQRAGLGWIGKHTQLIHPGVGSYCFIGVLMLNIELQYDEPIRPSCGGCTRCMDACPTKAINNGTIDARRCVSYLTIENKTEIPQEFHSQLSDCVLGCDICADVCPWNKKWAAPHLHPELAPVPHSADVPAMLGWNRSQWEQLSPELFSAAFRKSAIKRAGYLKLKQNLELLMPFSTI